MIKICDNMTIVFTGDSITDGHWRVEEYKPFGKGYVDFAANILLAQNPMYNLRIYNTGIGGNTTRDLKVRWQKDVIDLKPDILIMLIGINDIWRKHEPGRMAEHVGLDEYIENVKAMIEQACLRDTQIALLEPFMFCEDENNPMFLDTLEYGASLERLASRYMNITFIPMQKIISSEFNGSDFKRLSDDMVHPKRWAHCLLALKLLEYIKS